MLMIRLARFGKKKQPFFRIVVSDKKHTPRGKKVEYIGQYNPRSKDLVLDKERAAYWLSQGAGYSRTVGMMLIKEELIKKEDLPVIYRVEKKRKKKKEAEEATANKVPAETAAPTPAADPKPAEEPVAEAPIEPAKPVEKAVEKESVEPAATTKEDKPEPEKTAEAEPASANESAVKEEKDKSPEKTK